MADAVANLTAPIIYSAKFPNLYSAQHLNRNTAHKTPPFHEAGQRAVDLASPAAASPRFCRVCGHTDEQHATEAEMVKAGLTGARPCLWAFASSICPCNEYKEAASPAKGGR